MVRGTVLALNWHHPGADDCKTDQRLGAVPRIGRRRSSGCVRLS
jgi:hypothetical protein